MQDFCPIKASTTSSSTSATPGRRPSSTRTVSGSRNTAYRGLETGSRATASYVLEQGDIRFVLTSALVPDHPARSSSRHGDGVGVIALQVPDAAAAFHETRPRGAEPAHATGRTQRRDRRAARRGHPRLWRHADQVRRARRLRGRVRAGLPPATGRTASQSEASASRRSTTSSATSSWARWRGGSGSSPRRWGSRQLVHFDDKAISTEYSALMSKVMQDGTGRMKFPINEPATGRRKSQIQEYLDYYRGPGVQHIACATDDIVEDGLDAARRAASSFCACRRPTTRTSSTRVGKIDEPIDELAELGILADRDDEGYLLQIFTQPVEDRPTLFFEIIERHGCARVRRRQLQVAVRSDRARAGEAGQPRYELLLHARQDSAQAAHAVPPARWLALSRRADGHPRLHRRQVAAVSPAAADGGAARSSAAARSKMPLRGAGPVRHRLLRTADVPSRAATPSAARVR